MSEIIDKDATRDRSPAFPVIPLEAALTRLAEFESHFKRSPARPEKVGDAWKIKTKAYADRIAAALRYFGLLGYEGSGKDRQIVVTEEGRKYLRAQQEETKFEVVKSAALRPKQIAHFWNDWGSDRPADPACLDTLVLKNGFSEAGARDFLKVYDATIAFAKLTDSDKVGVSEEDLEEDIDDPPENDAGKRAPPRVDPAPKQRMAVMEGERELTTGLLSKDASFRLLVTGLVGEKEIERLIKKLELDKEILAEAAETRSANNDNKAAN